MRQEIKFYISKETNCSVIPNLFYDLISGVPRTESTACGISKFSTDECTKVSVPNDIEVQQGYVFRWSGDTYLGYTVVQLNDANEFEYILNPDENVTEIAFIFAKAIDEEVQTNRKLLYRVYPLYKELKKKFKKETAQMFFRESLDGNIKLIGSDFEIVARASLDDLLKLYVYKNRKLYSQAQFCRTDCKFDYFKKIVELKLQYFDRYSKIMNAYDNTYDLLKLLPETNAITLYKRGFIQIYNQGSNVISSYGAGTYWESEVKEAINDENALQNTYYFGKIRTIKECVLGGFTANINTSYTRNGTWVWNSKDQNSEQRGSIVFRLLIPHDTTLGQYPYTGTPIRLMSSDDGDGTYHYSSLVYTQYDTYSIEIWSEWNGEGTLLYLSECLYGRDVDRIDVFPGRGHFKMIRVDPDAGPESFYLSEKTINYDLWGRLLCDVSSFTLSGTTYNTYNLPYNDFAQERVNYKKCIGFTAFNNSSTIEIEVSSEFSNEPTYYGQNDYEQYFLPPANDYYYFPLAKKDWANTSLWVHLGPGYNNLIDAVSHNYIFKDAISLGDAIKAILKEIDPTIKHEVTEDFSPYLYPYHFPKRLDPAHSEQMQNCQVYITAKSNILKGQYDEAAKKAEVSLKILMEMVRDCFRCYWYIDEDNNFIIDYITKFNGGDIIMDLQSPVAIDKFNKKGITYAQQSIDFDKADMNARYEFSWMDDTTTVMGGDLYIDVLNEYVQKDKKSEIKLSKFTPDIDYMLLLPEDFSNDGFALLLADEDMQVPIATMFLCDENQKDTNGDSRTYYAYVQNGFCSFNYLAFNYLYDMPARNLKYNNVPANLYYDSLRVVYTKPFICHDMSIHMGRPYSVKPGDRIITDMGAGPIETLTEDMNTNLIEVEVRYKLESFNDPYYRPLTK